MPIIERLAPEVASKIAAGEVVERPYNVVKELMENAIDAGATKINIEIADGGLSLIRITDNGKGIEKEDLPLALERFATSKAKSIEDVYSAYTFGFRGEALAAISSVSDFSLISGTDNNQGYEIKSRFALVSDVKPIQSFKGTIVEVTNLFENVPARRKFLKSSRSLENEITRFVKHFSLINQNIDITLISNGRNIFEVFANEDICIKASKVFSGKSFHRGEIEFNSLKATVAATLPADSDRLKRDGIILGVNGRLIKDTSLVQAVIRAYFRLIPEGKYPIVVVDLRINPEEVDANVHPAKLEVRFEKPKDIFSIVSDTVVKSFEDKILISNYKTKEDVDISDNIVNLNDVDVNINRKEEVENKAEYVFNLSEISNDKLLNVSFNENNNIEENNSNIQHYENNTNIQKDEYIDNIKSKIDFNIIGQIANSFIVCETTDNQILFIDQHAAHERILFEKEQNKAQVEKTTIILHDTINVTLNEEQYNSLTENGDIIKDYGYSFNYLKDNEIEITKIPYNIVRQDISKIFKKIVSELYVSNKSKTEDAPRALLSCKSAIKAGDELSKYEMNCLLELLFDTDNYGTCPHGRPIIFSMSLKELARKFLR